MSTLGYNYKVRIGDSGFYTVTLVEVVKSIEDELDFIIIRWPSNAMVNDLHSFIITELDAKYKLQLNYNLQDLTTFYLNENRERFIRLNNFKIVNEIISVETFKDGPFSFIHSQTLEWGNLKVYKVGGHITFYNVDKFPNGYGSALPKRPPSPRI